MSIRIKLLLCFLLLSLLIFINGLIFYQQLKNLIQPLTPQSIPISVDKLVNVINKKDYISRLRYQQLQVDDTLEYYVLNPNVSNLQNYYLAASVFYGLLTKTYQLKQVEPENYETLIKSQIDLLEAQKNIINLAKQNNMALAKTVLESEEYKHKINNLQEKFMQYDQKFSIGSSDPEIVTVKVAIKNARNVLQNNLNFVITIFFDAVLISIIFAIIGSRNISYPIHLLRNEVENLDPDNIKEHINPKLLSLSGEIGDLTRSFSNLIRKLRSTTKQATNDSLTGLPNRILLSDRLQQAIENAKRNKTYLAILFIDLDSFKLINDSFGHIVGDQLLTMVAGRYKKYVRASDTIARLGGDEFVIILSVNTIEQKDLIPIIKIYFEVLEDPFQLSNHTINVSFTIGVSLYPRDGEDATTLINRADTAMYNAKNSGKNTFVFYQPEMTQESMEQLFLENDLRRAFKNNELFLEYQPLINIETGTIVSMEALMRWQHPTLGLIPPIQFIPIAESSGLIHSIGTWILKTACVQNKKWQDKGLPKIRISVNISSYQIKHPNFVNSIQKILEKTKLGPHYLELELTESLFINNMPEISSTILALKKLGVMIDIDNFGTGHSILNYIRELPIDTIKIDQSFVHEFHSNSKIKTLIEAMILISKGLNLNLIAEGVETKEELDSLMTVFSEIIQGYYFSEPLSAEKVEKLLAEFHINLKKE